MIKAVILAAGAGSRMGSLTTTTPKPLLPIDGRDPARTFLDWHLRCLAAVGVGSIYLVGSPRTAGTRLAAMDEVAADWILNPTTEAGASGSAHSAWFAWHSPQRILDGRSRVILMDADIVYVPSVLADLLAGSGTHSRILVAAEHRDTGEEVLVFADPERPEVPRRQGKGLAGSAAVAGRVCLGEATGIMLWEPADHATLAERTDWAVRHSAAGARSEHEDVTQQMMTRDRVRAVRFGPERAFLEVDTPEDYRRLVEEVAPGLLARA
jgi:choline kinase